MVAAALLAAIGAVAIADLAVVVARVPASLRESGGLAGFVGVLAAVAATVSVLWWVARRPNRTSVDVVALFTGIGLLLAARTAAVILVDAPLIVDWMRYHELALTILQGGDWFAAWPSGYSLLLAAGYSLFGPDPSVGEWLNVALGAASGCAVYLIALRAAGSRAAGAALVLYAATPAEILMTPVLGTEIAYGALLAGSLAVLLTAPPTLVRAAVAGLLLGASQWVRATSQLLAPFLAAAAARFAPAGRRTATGLAFLGAFTVVLFPVLLANLERSGAPSLSTSSFAGWQLLLGTNQVHDGRFNAEDVALVGGVDALGTPEAERIALRVALERVGDDPLGTLGLVARKLPQTWGDAHYGARWALYVDPAQDPRAVQAFVLLSQLSWAAVATLAALGAWRARRSAWRTVAVLALVIGVSVVIHAAGEANPRYHAPLVPLVSVLAGLGLAGVAARLPGPREGSAERIDP